MRPTFNGGGAVMRACALRTLVGDAVEVVEDALELAQPLPGHGAHEEVAEVDARVLLPHRLLAHLRAVVEAPH